jgi:hypothetical protein
MKVWQDRQLSSGSLLGLFMSLSIALPVWGQAGIPADSVSHSKAHPLDPAIDFTRSSLQHMRENIGDYTAILVKRNRVNDKLGDLTYAAVKIRNRRTEAPGNQIPLSVYLSFLKPESVKGREVIWVEGRNEGKLLAHEAGLKNLATVKLDPTGYLAMRGQRYPITEIGIENLTAKILETASRDRQHAECQVQFYKNAKIGDDMCDMFEVVHPVQREHFDFYRARVYFSQKHGVPIRYASWSWPTQPGGEPVLEEEYTYLQLKPNVGLTDRDFDTDNPAYRFW